MRKSTRRRFRRALFNLFAFSLLGIAVYLNKYQMNYHQPSAADIAPAMKNISKEAEKTSNLTKINARQNSLSLP